MAIRLTDEFPARTKAPTASYPDGSYMNETSPGANDGTPLDERVGDDYEGFKQGLLDKAGITPNGQPDSVTNPQQIQAIEKFIGDGDSQLAGGAIWPLSSQDVAQIGDTLQNGESIIILSNQSYDLVPAPSNPSTIVSIDESLGEVVFDTGTSYTVPTNKDFNKVYGITDGSDHSSAFTRAGNVMKNVESYRPQLNQGYQYNINTTGVYFLSKVDGNQANITCADGVTFDKEGAAIVNITDLTITTIGNKSNAAGAAGPDLFAIGGTNEHDKVVVKQFKHIALTDGNDPDSWSDDANQARYKGTFRFVSNDITFQDNRAYGIGLFVKFDPLTDSVGVTKVSNNKGYNVETLLWYDSSDPETLAFSESEIYKNGIVNTATQQTYWINKDIGANLNGKSTLLMSGNHTYRAMIRDISAHRSIERSVYCQEKNCNISGTREQFTLRGSAMLKYEPVAGQPDTRPGNRLNNAEHRGNTDSNTDLQIYGQDKALYNDLVYVNSDPANVRRVIEFSRVNQFVVIDGVYMDNANVAFYTATVESGGNNGITIRNVRCQNVVSGSSQTSHVFDFRDVFGDLVYPTYTNLKLENISSLLNRGTIYTDINSTALSLWKMDGVIMDNVKADFQFRPWDSSGSNDVECWSSIFRVHNNQPIDVAWSRLDNDEFKASRFDFEIRSSIDASSEEWSARFKKIDGTNMERCTDYWDSLDYQKDLDTSALFTVIPFKEGLRVTASFDDSYTELLFDGTASFVDVATIGTAFTNSPSTGINIDYNATEDSIVVRRNAGVGVAGILKVACYHK